MNRKLPDDGYIAFTVGRSIAHGAEESDAIAEVAESFGVDGSTVAKRFRERRAAVANYFLITNLAHRYA